MPQSRATARARSTDELAIATGRPLATLLSAVRCWLALRPVPTIPTPTRRGAATALLRDLGQAVVQDAGGAHAVDVGLQVQDDPVAKRRVGDLANVLVRDVEATLEQRPDLASQHQRLRAARARAVANVVVGDLRDALAPGVGRQHDPARVVEHLS